MDLFSILIVAMGVAVTIMLTAGTVYDLFLSKKPR